jgi:hypothetical protein
MEGVKSVLGDPFSATIREQYELKVRVKDQLSQAMDMLAVALGWNEAEPW